MIAKDLILQNPLRRIGNETEDILPEGGFGAVFARAGVGKTALLVQLSLHNILQNKNALHVSLDDPVKKVSLWYKEVFSYLTKSYDVEEANQLWEKMLPKRFIMTFNVNAFTLKKLERRLSDLKEQNIFVPQVILIDGLPFNPAIREPLSDLKRLAKENSFHVWFTIKTPRHEDPGLDGMPAPLVDVADMFEVVLQLQPKGKEIHVTTLKGGSAETLVLDPSTMLIKRDL